MNGGLAYVMTRHYDIVYLHQYSAELGKCVMLKSYTMPLNYKAILQFLVAPAEV
jgi:hypothetical protein